MPPHNAAAVARYQADLRKRKQDKMRAEAARKRAAASAHVAARRTAESRAVARGSDPKRVEKARQTQKERDYKRKVASTPTFAELQGKGNKDRRKQIAGVLPGVDTKDVKEVEDAIIGLPGGLYGIGRSLLLDAVKPKGGPLDFKHSRSAPLAKEIAKATYRDIRHPGRNPLMTALTVSGFASAGAGTAARGAAAAKALGEGGVKAAAKTALKKPVPGPRTHLYEGQPIRGRYSDNPSARAVQRSRDKAAARKAEYKANKTGERVSTISATKAERLLSEERRVGDAAAKAPALKALALSHDLDDPKDLAIRVAAEGIPLDDVIEAHVRRAEQVEVKRRNLKRGGVPGGGHSHQQAIRLGKQNKELLRKAALLEESRKYLEHGDPPVAKGHVRLYRGEGKRGPLSPETPDWINDVRGGWYSDKRMVAEEYAKRNDGKVYYADVPENVARAFSRERVWGQHAEPWTEYTFPDKVRERYGITNRTERESTSPRVVPSLARHAAAGEKAALTRETRLKKAGLLSLESAERRKHQPGRDMVRTVGGGRAVKTERPRTVAEARAELDKLDAKIDRITKPVIERQYQLHRDDWKSDAAASKGGKPKSRVLPPGETPVRFKGTGGKIDIQRTSEKMIPAQEGAGGYGHAKVHKTGRDAAESDFWNRIAKSDHPLAVRLKKMQAEADELRRTVEPHEEPSWMREGELPDLGTKTEFQRFEDVEPFIGGNYRVPDTLRSKRKPHGPIAYRGGVPRKPGTLTHEYTGSARRSGTYTTQTLKAIAEDALEAERYLSVERFRQRVLPMGHKVRPADSPGIRGFGRTRYVPVRERKLTKTESEKLRKTLEGADIERLTPDEAARVDEAIKAYERNIFPERAEYAHVPPGEAIPGVKWVDEKLLGSQRKLIGRLPVIDEASDAVKGLILYGKPGYVTPNIVGNAALNVFQQGFLAPANWVRAVRLPKDLDFMVKEVMGAGYSRALAEGTLSPISHAVQFAGNFWSHFVDDPFRKAAFIHEARRRGFKSNDELRALIEDGRFRSQQAEISQRARDAIIDYERLGPIERDLVRRLLFIYPWIKGSTYYGAQFLRDHPIQAAVFAKIGEQGNSQALKDIGPVPAWAKGSFRVGGSDAKPLVVNPAAISPFGTPAQVSAAARGFFGETERSEQLFEFTNPILQAGVEATGGRELFTGRALEGGYPERFVKQISKGLPQVLLPKRIREADDPATQEKAYPYTVPQAIGQYVIGSSSPRSANRAVLNDQAAGAHEPSKLEKLRTERKAVLPQLRGKMPPADAKYVQRAYAIAEGMETLREKTRDDTGEGEPYYRAVLAAEATFLRDQGIFPKADATYLIKLAKTGTYDEVRKRRNALVQGPYESIYLTAKRNARKLVGYESP